MEIPVSDAFSIESGLYYAKKGVAISARLDDVESGLIDFLNVQATLKNQAHYIDLPILAKVYPVNGFHIFAGPQFSYLTSNKLDIEAGLFGLNVVNETIDIGEPFRKLDVGISTGLGYQFDNGINLSAAYDFGLTSLDENDNFDVYNRVAKFSVGYRF